MVDLILSFEGHITTLPLDKAIVYHLISKTATKIKFFFKEGT
jgi:hypothetical protein